MNRNSDWQDKDLIVFDLDGTLAPSKKALSLLMARNFLKLLAVKKVAVIGGGKYMQFKKQLIARLGSHPALFKNLFLFPATGTSFYRYERGWKTVYEKDFPLREVKKIKKALTDTLAEVRYVRPKKTWGALIEDRHTQITFSALGQRAPLLAKEMWRKESDIRPILVKKLRKRLPECAVHAGGLTSVDITEQGIDKAYGLLQMEKYLHIPIKKMVFVGDAFGRHGNDTPVKRTGVQWVAVKNPIQAVRVIAGILAVGR